MCRGLNCRFYRTISWYKLMSYSQINRAIKLKWCDGPPPEEQRRKRAAYCLCLGELGERVRRNLMTDLLVVLTSWLENEHTWRYRRMDSDASAAWTDWTAAEHRKQTGFSNDCLECATSTSSCSQHLLLAEPPDPSSSSSSSLQPL